MYGSVFFVNKNCYQECCFLTFGDFQSDGVTPLWIACLKGHLTIVMALLAKGASVRAVEVCGVCPPMNGYLSSYGARWPLRCLHFQMDSGCTTLHVASLKGSAPLVTALLGAGAAVDATRVR
jgi:ankyrin repeat protein